MDGFASYILTSLAFVFVIEGLLYALFADTLRRMMQLALTMPLQTLRFLGASMAIVGFSMVWILSLL